jgi:hypothetical protein
MQFQGHVTLDDLIALDVSRPLAVRLIEAGFDYVTGKCDDDDKLFWKRK